MKKYLIAIALAVCLGGLGAFAQAEAPAADQPPAAPPAAGQQGATSSSED